MIYWRVFSYLKEKIEAYGTPISDPDLNFNIIGTAIDNLVDQVLSNSELEYLVAEHNHAGGCYKTTNGTPYITNNSWDANGNHGICRVSCRICGKTVGNANGTDWRDNTYTSRAVSQAKKHFTKVEEPDIWKCATYPDATCKYADFEMPYIHNIYDLVTDPMISGDTIIAVKMKPKSKT